MLRPLLLACALCLSCASAAPDPAGDFGAWGEDYSELRLSFVDPETHSRYTVEGPFRVVEAVGSGLALEGMDARFLVPVRLLVFEREEAIWALARIEGHEFLTRLD